MRGGEHRFRQYRAAVRWIAANVATPDDETNDAVRMVAALDRVSPGRITRAVAQARLGRGQIIAAVKCTTARDGEPPSLHKVAREMNANWQKTKAALDAMALAGEVRMMRRGRGPIRVSIPLTFGGGTS